MKKTKTKKGHYEVQYLAVAIIVFLLLEVGLFSIADQADWQAGASLLDMSSSINRVSSDLAEVFQPVTNTISDLNLFYQTATTAMIQLLDMSSANFFGPLTVVVDGVYEFYQQAADQMASLLDMNSPVVAGISIVIR